MPPVKLPNSTDSLYFFFRWKEQPQLLNMNLMACLVSSDHMKTKVFSTEITNILVNSWKTGTQSSYGTYIREWFGFCTKQQIDPMHPNISKVLEFLHSLKVKNVSYSVINTARSALSTSIMIDSHTIGMHPLVFSLF